jgi:hypothetical protein
MEVYVASLLTFGSTSPRDTHDASFPVSVSKQPSVQIVDPNVEGAICGDFSGSAGEGEVAVQTPLMGGQKLDPGAQEVESL